VNPRSQALPRLGLKTVDDRGEIDVAKQTRSIKTRDAILTAAAALFGEFGYNGTSTNDILQRSGASRGALYHHFASKLDIADAVVTLKEQALVPPERAIKLQAVIALSFQYSRQLMTDPVQQGVVRLAAEQATYRQPDATPYEVPERVVLNLMRQAHGAGELLPGADPERFARLLVGAFFGIQNLSDVATNRADLIDRLADFWRFVLPGLATPGLLPRLRIPDLPSEVWS
jgi:AcrR family transcriptional regulator